jgi:hypothetical protein
MLRFSKQTTPLSLVVRRQFGGNTVTNLLPESLRRAITWKKLPASPLAENLIASFLCPETKKLYHLELKDSPKTAELVVRCQATNVVFTFEDGQFPKDWQISDGSRISRPGTP